MKKTIAWMLLLSLTVGAFLTALPISAAEASDQPKAPVALDYRLDQIGGGMASGVVTVTLPAGHGAEDIYLFWGDENGKLSGYTAFAPFKVSGNVVTHRIPNGTVIPQGATRLLACTYSDGFGLSDAYASFTLPQGAALTDETLGALRFEFQSVSDIHITTTVADRLHHSDHMRAMLEDIMAISPNSIGIFNNGDTVNNGLDEDYEEFLAIYNSYADAPIIYSGFGNHELFRYGLPPKKENFSDMIRVYWDFLSETIPEDATFCGGTRFGSLSFSFIENDCKFIFLGTDVLDQNNLSLYQSTIDWLEGELEAGRGNPTFIIMHQPMYGTLAGSFKDGYGVTKDTAEPLKALLANYPEVIMFNGHTHRDMDQYGIHYDRDEKLPSIFGTSSVGYLARTYDKISTETHRGSQGYYVYVYEDKVYVRGRDFVNGQWIASAQFVVDLSEEALEKTPDKQVEAPLYGGTATLTANANQLSGTIQCNLPVNNNATAIALFFSDSDTGIIGTNPFATLEVDCKDNYFTCEVPFADVPIPGNADYILAYSYSDTLGWSADCDVIYLDTHIRGGGAPVAGTFSMNKYSFSEGEPMLVTAYKNEGTSWIGIRNVASSDTRTWNYWRVADVGIGTTVDISKDHSAFKRDFTALKPGVYEIGWIAESGGGFLAGKTPTNTTTFVIHSSDNEASGGAVKMNKSYYRVGEPILVTAKKGSGDDWIGTQLSTVYTGTVLWYNLSVSGVNKTFDITDRAKYIGVEGEDYAFGTLGAGKYQLAWMSSDKDRFQTGKEAKNTVTFTVVDMDAMLPLGVPVGVRASEDVDLSALNGKLVEIGRLNQKGYTADSWQALQTAVDAAMLVRGDLAHTQDAINAACDALAAAMKGLVEAPFDPNAPQTPPEDETETQAPPARTEQDTQSAPPQTEQEPEITTPDSGAESTADSSEEKSILGCGSAVASAPFLVMLAWIPMVFKKKRSE